MIVFFPEGYSCQEITPRLTKNLDDFPTDLLLDPYSLRAPSLFCLCSECLATHTQTHFCVCRLWRCL